MTDLDLELLLQSLKSDTELLAAGFKWMAIDSDGKVYIYTEEPERLNAPGSEHYWWVSRYGQHKFIQEIDAVPTEQLYFIGRSS